MIESNKNSSNKVQSQDYCEIEGLYNEEEAKGFDMSNGQEWIYPTNYPVRNYQKNIVTNALFKNTLVCLPTGLGKTFIAAVVLYNYHRWYPKHIKVFMAHSKPLVAQQVQACCDIMGISQSVIGELNGNMLPAVRKKHWETKKIFFLTPQVFNNDLARGIVNPESIRCLVVDEAHKAVGNQAYCQVIRSIKPFNSNFRVLALSATPGDDMNMVKEVIKNLLISHLELRNEEDPDIKPYLHEKKIETIIIQLDEQILDVKDRILNATRKYIEPLMKNKIIPQSFSSINPFSLVLKQKQFMQNPSIAPQLRGLMLSNFSVSISLFHAIEELVIHGMRSFVTRLKCLLTGDGSNSKVHHRLAKDEELKSVIDYVEEILGPDHNVSFDVNSSFTRILDEIDSIDTTGKVVYSHPKFVALEKIITNHFETQKDSSKVIVFCKSRQCTGEICNFLARFRPLVKPMIFIGQSQSSGIVAKGFNQATQLTVMKRFREGVYNTLIATCVAEEGLDVGEVDLIVNFDSGKNSNTRVQRSGRTGRKRDGRVVNLVTEGKEFQNYNISVYKGKKINKQLSSNGANLPFYMDNPRLIPKSLNPVCHEMYLIVKKHEEEEPKEKGKRVKTGKKKLQETSSENKTNKKMKMCNDVSEKAASLWTTVTDNKFGADAAVEVPVRDDIEVEEMVDGCFQPCTVASEKHNNKRVLPGNNDAEIEVIDLEEPEVRTIYDDDVKQPIQWDEIANELEDVELEEWNREGEGTNASGDTATESLGIYDKSICKIDKRDIVKLLKKYHSSVTPKFDLKELFNKKRFTSYPKREFNSSDLMVKMRALENCTLNDCGMECLADESLNTDSLVTRLVESKSKILRNEDSTSMVAAVSHNTTKRKFLGKENRPPGVYSVDEGVRLVNELDPNDFLVPMDENIPLKRQMISSTPVGKVKKESSKIRGEVLETSTKNNREPSPIQDHNFQNWDDSDFFDLNCSVSHQKVDDRKSSTKKKDDVSLISITQALDLVNAKTTNPVQLVENPRESKNWATQKATTPTSPSSPILFFSQKMKTTRTQAFEPTSPILTQSTGAKRSRKCLNFVDNTKSPDVKPKITPLKDKCRFDEGDGSDLFAETEIALQNHLDELEANLGEGVGAAEGAVVESSTENHADDENTVDYDLGVARFDPNKTPESILKSRNASREGRRVGRTSPSEEKSRVDGEASAGDLVKNEVSSFLKDEFSKRKSEVSLSAFGANDFSSFFRNETPSDLQKSAVKGSESKAAPFEALTINDKRSGRSSVAGSGLNVSNQKSKYKETKQKTDQPSFTCSFSLFADDDFNEICFAPAGNSSTVRDKCPKDTERGNKDEGSTKGQPPEDDISSDGSDFIVNKDNRQSDTSKSFQEQGNPFEKDDELFRNLMDEGDLSDGAEEAIRAVEAYERDARLAEKAAAMGDSMNLIDIDSDDSGDFFLPVKKANKQRTVTENEEPNKIVKTKPAKGAEKKNAKPRPAAFIDAEAEISDHGEPVSSDEENTSGLDEFDSSFVDEREILTQAPDVDMTAKYLQSTKARMGGQRGRFKIPEAREEDKLNVFSQIGSEGESEYEKDSFCVSEEEQTEVHDLSELELAEIVLQYQEKLQQKLNGTNVDEKSLSIPSAKKRKRFKRVRRIESDSEDEVEEVKVPAEETKPAMQVNQSNTNDSSDIQELFALPFPSEVLTSSSTSVTESRETSSSRMSPPRRPDPNVKPVIFIASRQIAGAPEIATCLRARWNVNVNVRSAPEADYIVSWRVGVNRVMLSDFASGSPSARTTLKEMLQKLSSRFHEPVLIVEDDKNKGLPMTTGCNKFMWARHSSKTLVGVLRNNVKVLFSRNKDETAKILVKVWNVERDKGHQINLTSEIDATTERKMKFFSSLPGMNMANAFRMTRKFSSIESFIKCCDSVAVITREMGIRRDAALKVYHYLFTTPSS